jgi:hypothetical protein
MMLWASAAWSALSTRVGRWALAVGAALAVLWGAYRKGRTDAVTRARARAAEQEQARRRQGDAAASDAASRGADDGLRRGDF